VRAVETVERKDRVLIVEDEDNARKGYEQLLQAGLRRCGRGRRKRARGQKISLSINVRDGEQLIATTVHWPGRKLVQRPATFLADPVSP